MLGRGMNRHEMQKLYPIGTKFSKIFSMKSGKVRMKRQVFDIYSRFYRISGTFAVVNDQEEYDRMELVGQIK